MTRKDPLAPRCAALVGPYLSGKTSLFESLLFAAGAIPRKGSVKDGNTVGDATPEARDRQMSTELSVAEFEYLGDPWTLIDCPGSVELQQDALNALMVVDLAVVVAEPAPDKALTVAPLLKFLDDHDIPHAVFVNRMDSPSASVRGTLEALQAVSSRPLVLREIPVREGDALVGFVDLVSERAYRFNEGKPSDLVKMPEAVVEEEQEARNEMLESLADFDDQLLEELLEETVPSTEEIYDNLTRDLAEDLIVPVLFGSAEHDHGIRRLLKLLRHETPEPEATAGRLGLDRVPGAVARVFKTVYAGHSGKMSLARVFGGEIADGSTLNGERVGGVSGLMGQQTTKKAKAVAGEVVALGRMDGARTGDVLVGTGEAPAVDWPAPLTPLYGLAIEASNRGDEVKLTGALAKLVEEDPSLSVEQNPDTGEMVLWGQGDVHLQTALTRMAKRYKVEAQARPPSVPYKETIRRGASQHARHKKQSGGHGEFGDVHIEVAPLPRGGGFAFSDTITGGAIPKQYIPAVESGVREYMERGPMGFPVVDIAVTLTDGGFHAVDSSEMAFKKAAQAAMREAMPQCQPVLLEPICKVSIAVPNEFTSKAQRLVSGRRGQIMGFDAREGWPGWDEVQALLPQAEMRDLVTELRSLTMGIGHFRWEYDHLQELTGRVADQVVEARQAAQ